MQGLCDVQDPQALTAAASSAVAAASGQRTQPQATGQPSAMAASPRNPPAAGAGFKEASSTTARDEGHVRHRPKAVQMADLGTS